MAAAGCIVRSRITRICSPGKAEGRTRDEARQRRKHPGALRLPGLQELRQRRERGEPAVQQGAVVLLLTLRYPNGEDFVAAGNLTAPKRS